MMLILGKLYSYIILYINKTYFSKINHKVKFELDEEGVEGAAAANIEIPFRNIASPKPIVIARPFYFTVSAICRNKTTKQGCPYGNIPIFIGKVPIQQTVQFNFE